MTQNLEHYPIDWLRNLKESFPSLDPWQKIAYIYAIASMPEDEKKYFINRQSFFRVFDIELSKWSRSV